MIENNPVHITHTKYVYRFVRELMRQTLTETEDQLVMLHCGIYTKGKIMSFAQLAELFSLDNAQEAKRIYQEAIRRTRAAIPGSKLEFWINCYHMTYYPENGYFFQIAVDSPVNDWDT